MRLPPPDYFLALEAKRREASIKLAGRSRRIVRARLGRHHELLAIMADEAMSPGDRALVYISVAARSAPEPYPEEVAPAFDALMQLNEPAQVPAIARHRRVGGMTPGGLRYRGRFLTNIVHELAYNYGWTAAYILEELGPEEALCYLQEIAVQVHDERAFQYSLSDAGRDKHGRQRPFPRLPWLGIPYEDGAPKRPVPERFRPAGEIVRMS